MAVHLPRKRIKLKAVRHFIAGAGMAFMAAWALAQGIGASAGAGAGMEPVSRAEVAQIRNALKSIGLAQADVLLGEDGRVVLAGEYENRDEVETAFAAARAVVGLRRVAPTSPSNVKYRLQGFGAAFSSTVAKMMQKAPAASGATGISATLSESASASLNEADSARRPQTMGIIVGASKSKYLPAKHWLEGAEKDAKDIYSFLASPEGGATRSENLLLLTKEEATSDAVRKAMQNLLGRAQPGDTAILFVAAHGLPNAMNKFDIVLYDTEFPRKKAAAGSESVDFVITNRKTALTDDELQGFVARLTAKNVRSVLVLDTCYSGKTFVSIPGYLPSRTRSLKQHAKEAEYTTSLSQEAISDLAQKAKEMKTSRIVIVSASENEESLEAPSLGGGAFTQTYIGSLRKLHDFADAFDQAKPSVIRIARTMGMSQTPRMLVVPEAAHTKM